MGRMKYGEWVPQVSDILDGMGARFEDGSPAFWRMLYQQGLTPMEAVDALLADRKADAMDAAVDRAKYGEGVCFDKFMDRLLTENRKQLVTTDSPQRLRAARNQDRPANRTRFSR